MPADRPSLARIGLALAYALPVLTPFLLLANLDLRFRQDWPDHVWAIDYYGRYLRSHHEFPSVLNHSSAVGIALPVFYGWLLYPLLGALAAVIGAELAIRTAVVALGALTFRITLQAARRLTNDRGVAYLVATAVLWSTYSLTNLYNRGGLAEYFALAFLSIAAGFGALTFSANSKADRQFFGWMTGLFALLAAGAHPTSAVLGAAFIGLLGLTSAVTFLRDKSRIAVPWLAFVGIGAIGVVVLAPWLYASATLNRFLGVTQYTSALIFMPERSDSLVARLAPFPVDFLSAERGTVRVSTPYLEAPISTVLLGLLVFNLIVLFGGGSTRLLSNRNRQLEALVAASGAWFIFLVLLSVSPAFAAPFAWMAPYVQFAYRCVGHANLALLIGVFASGALARAQGGYVQFRRQTELILAVGLTTGVLGLGMKLLHSVPPDVGPQSDQRTPNIRVLAQGYSVLDQVPSLAAPELEKAAMVRLAVTETPGKFGEIQSARVDANADGWVVTNVVPFPWVRLSDLDKDIPLASLAEVDHRLAVKLSAGEHRLAVRWQSDPLWRILRTFSYFAFAALLLASAAWALARLFRPTGNTGSQNADLLPR